MCRSQVGKVVIPASPQWDNVLTRQEPHRHYPTTTYDAPRIVTHLNAANGRTNNHSSIPLVFSGVISGTHGTIRPASLLRLLQLGRVLIAQSALTALDYCAALAARGVQFIRLTMERSGWDRATDSPVSIPRAYGIPLRRRSQPRRKGGSPCLAGFPIARTPYRAMLPVLTTQ